jgi:hypothetical protein
MSAARRGPPEAQRVLTDNAWAYGHSTSFRAAVLESGRNGPWSRCHGVTDCCISRRCSFPRARGGLTRSIKVNVVRRRCLDVGSKLCYGADP